MIKKIISKDKAYVKMSSLIILTLGLIAVVYFLGYKSTQNVQPSKMIRIQGEKSLEITNKIESSLDTESIEKAVTQEDEVVYYIYLEDVSEDSITEVVGEIEIGDTTIGLSNIKVVNSISFEDILIVSVFLNIVLLIAIKIAYKSSMPNSKIVIFGIGNIFYYYITVLFVLSIISILEFFGINNGTFSYGVLGLVALFTTIYLAYSALDPVKMKKDGISKINGLADLHTDSLIKNLNANTRVALIISLALLPFLFVREYTIEILLLIISIWSVFKVVNLFYPSLGYSVDNIGNKSKGKKKK